MRIDFYTKALLTIIAVCLLALLAGRAPALHAQATRPFPTIITGNNFGIRIDGWSVGKPITETLLVQVNGRCSLNKVASVAPAARASIEQCRVGL